MANNNYPNVKTFIICVLSNNAVFNSLKACRATFIFYALFYFSAIKSKINFLQLQRFSGKCEQYFRINFENKFNFQAFNLEMIKERVTECIIALDPSFIAKSGKRTYGPGSYWSGCAGAVKRGLEICGFAVVDVIENTAFHLNAIQTPKSKDFNLVHHYCQIIRENYLYFKTLSSYLVADSFFAKSEVIETVTALGLHFICRLRDDAALLYLNRKPKTGKKGAPRKYAGKVSVTQPDMNYFKRIYNTKELKVYYAIVYYPAFKRNLNLSITVFYDETGKETARKLYFSTVLKLNGMKIVSYYRSRFQIEFLYRDAKQHSGLESCQALSKNKLHLHLNAALTVVNLAKLFWLDTRESVHDPFSMANYKTLCKNMMLLNRFFTVFAIDPNNPKNQNKIKELMKYGLIAA